MAPAAKEALPFVVLVLGLGAMVISAFAPESKRAEKLMSTGDLLLGAGIMGLAPAGIRLVQQGMGERTPTGPQPTVEGKKGGPVG